MASDKQIAYWQSLKGKQPKNMEGLKLGRAWNKKKRKIKMIFCACGCGEKLNKYDSRWRERKYIEYHEVRMLGKNRGFKKGHKSWNKGKKGLAEAWNKGLTKETDERIRKGAKKREGRKANKETCRKISKALKGRASPNKGKKASKEVRRRMSEAHKGEYNSEHYRKIGLKGIKAQQSGSPTSIEKKVYQELKERGLLFETQKVINGKFVVDAYIPKFNLVIEADGDYWHGLDRVKKRDKAKNAYLKKCGFGLLRLTETKINNGQFRGKIKEVIDG